MTRSILEIAQEAAERDATAPRPDTLFNTNDRIAKILRTAAHDVMRDFLRRTDWAGNSELQSTWIFTLIPGRFAYSLPPDYLRIIPHTEQREGWAMGLVGPASPQTWAWWITGLGAVASPLGWRIRNDALWIEPTPRASELVTIDYISKYPVVSPVREGDYNLNGSLPVTNAPFVPRDGHLSREADPEAFTEGRLGNALFGREDAGFGEGEWPADPLEIIKRVNPMSAQDPLPQVRRPYFVSDADTPAFRDDHTLSLGMTFHLQRALGLPYAERAAEYEHEVETKANSDAGGPRSFTLGHPLDGVDVWPLGDGNWLLS